MNRTLDLIWLRIREYFKHPAEDIRQAIPIVPRRLYTNFGYICKAVPYSRRERDIIDRINSAKDGSASGLLYDTVLQEAGIQKVEGVASVGCVQEEVAILGDTYCRCVFCDFHRKAIPCPIYNQLKDGSTVCDSHKYVILKNPR